MKNAAGCVSSATSVTVNAQPSTPATPTASVTTQPTCAVATGTITVTAPTGAGLGYSIDGVDYSNTTGVFTNVIPNTYSVTVKNAAGCISPATSVTINTQPQTPAAPTVNVTQPTCAVATGTITVTAPTGAGLGYSIDGVDYSNATGVFTAVAPGTYNVTVKNAAGCISAATAVTVNAAPSSGSAPTVSVTTQPTCAIPTGTITVTAPAPAAGISYSIDGADYTNATGVFTAVAPGPYNVTVKNAAGCISAATAVTVNAAPSSGSAPTVSVTTQPTCAVATGTITVTTPAPAAGISYSIDGADYTNATGVFTAVAPGTYNVTVKNAAGCISAALSVTINAAPAAPAVPTATTTSPTTCAVATGTITVTTPAPAAGISYSIDGADYTNATGVFTAVAPGPYNVTVKNAAGCISAALSVTINAAPAAGSAPTVSVTTSPTTCAVATGTITVTTPAPAAGISYSIDGADYTNATGVFTAVAPGTYNVTVKNAAGCISAALSVTINAPAPATTVTCDIRTHQPLPQTGPPENAAPTALPTEYQPSITGVSPLSAHQQQGKRPLHQRQCTRQRPWYCVTNRSHQPLHKQGRCVRTQHQLHFQQYQPITLPEHGVLR